MKQQGIKGINLKEDEFAINCNSYEYKELYTYYIKNNKDKLNIEGFKLKLGQKNYMKTQLLQNN
ncbi:ABC superfamily ATP binding cassette transporter domain protein [[Clostridium] sordellii ATCC 9714]|nr:ABC superfamily ATP binding cassette transporter domain protein [[Clostridium] sordellii ATCC 9714] [Paeniclostridium sordellii ATCC 9714]